MRPGTRSVASGRRRRRTPHPALRAQLPLVALTAYPSYEAEVDFVATDGELVLHETLSHVDAS